MLAMMKNCTSTIRKNILIGLAFVCLAWLLQPAAYAQSNAELLESLRDCQGVAQMSARLACYDQLLPPGTGASEASDTPDSGVSLTPPPRQAAPEMREDRRSPRPARPDADADDNTVQIVDVERPQFRSFRLTTADGRVYVYSNAVRIPQWPDTPFEAEIQTSIIGNSTYLNVPSIRTRVRVVLEN